MGEKLPSDKRFINITGDRYGMLTAVVFVERKNCHNFWLCKCDCGVECVKTSNALRSGRVKSCGCSRGEFVRQSKLTHGMSQGCRLYKVWSAMRERCVSPGSSSYERYGARGICVCQEWQDSFESFVASVGERPSPDHSLERIDNNKGYEPGNVWWATRSQQARNRRDSFVVNYLGITANIADWEEITGVSPRRISDRVKKGWSLLRAMTEKPKNATSFRQLPIGPDPVRINT